MCIIFPFSCLVNSAWTMQAVAKCAASAELALSFISTCSPASTWPLKLPTIINLEFKPVIVYTHSFIITMHPPSSLTITHPSTHHPLTQGYAPMQHLFLTLHPAHPEPCVWRGLSHHACSPVSMQPHLLHFSPAEKEEQIHIYDRTNYNPDMCTGGCGNVNARATKAPSQSASV